MRPVPPARLRIWPSKSCTSSKLLLQCRKPCAAGTAAQARRCCAGPRRSRSGPRRGRRRPPSLWQDAQLMYASRARRVSRGVVEELLALAATCARQLLAGVRRPWSRAAARPRCPRRGASPRSYTPTVRSMKLLTYRRLPSADSARPCGARPTSIAEQLVAADAHRRPPPGGWSPARRTGRRRAVERDRARDARVVVVDARRVVLGSRPARSMRELIARTVFWKLSAWPSRRVPRLTLSCLDGTQAERPSGEIVRRRGSSGRRGPGSRSPACRCAAARSSVRTLIAGAFTTTTSPPRRTVVCTTAVLSPGRGGVMKRDT